MAPSFLANQCWINEVELQTGPSVFSEANFLLILSLEAPFKLLLARFPGNPSLADPIYTQQQVPPGILGWWIEFTWRINPGMPCSKTPNVNMCLKVSRAGVNKRVTVLRNIFLDERGCKGVLQCCLLLHTILTSKKAF